MPVLLWRHVVRCSDARGSQICFFVQHLRNPEISQLYNAIRNEDVRGFQIAVEDTLIVHIEDSEGDLSGPVDYLFFFEFAAPLVLLLLQDELVEISAVAELHDDIEFLAFDNGLSIADDVDVFELFEELDLIENVFGLLLVLVGEFDLLDYEILVGLEVSSQIGVAEGSTLIKTYPCPIIFKILYSFIIHYKTTPTLPSLPPPLPPPLTSSLSFPSDLTPSTIKH